MPETVLLSTLDAYAKQLDAQLAALRTRHQELEAAWARLRDVYEGEGAQIFGEAFEAASKELAEYAIHGAAVTRQLQNKIGELRSFQAADSTL
jgi:uncharacterized protein YukE